MKVTLSQIKSWFKKGMYPTESQFANAFDSFWHKDDTLPLSAIQNLAQVLNDKASIQSLETKANADHKHTLEDITDIDDFKIEVDAELSETSENPVQNKVVKEALDAKQPVGNYAEENHNHDEAYSPLEHEHAQYLTEHQDISGKQDKTDNSLLSTAKTKFISGIDSQLNFSNNCNLSCFSSISMKTRHIKTKFAIIVNIATLELFFPCVSTSSLATRVNSIPKKGIVIISDKIAKGLLICICP